MRKAALAAHRARTPGTPRTPSHAVARRRRGAHAALLLRAATGRAHYSSGPVAVVGTLLYASGFQVKAQKCCATARAASREPLAQVKALCHGSPTCLLLLLQAKTWMALLNQANPVYQG